MPDLSQATLPSEDLQQFDSAASVFDPQADEVEAKAEAPEQPPAMSLQVKPVPEAPAADPYDGFTPERPSENQYTPAFDPDVMGLPKSSHVNAGLEAERRLSVNPNDPIAQKALAIQSASGLREDNTDAPPAELPKMDSTASVYDSQAEPEPLVAGGHDPNDQLHQYVEKMRPIAEDSWRKSAEQVLDDYTRGRIEHIPPAYLKDLVYGVFGPTTASGELSKWWKGTNEARVGSGVGVIKDAGKTILSAAIRGSRSGEGNEDGGDYAQNIMGSLYGGATQMGVGLLDIGAGALHLGAEKLGMDPRQRLSDIIQMTQLQHDASMSKKMMFPGVDEEAPESKVADFAGAALLPGFGVEGAISKGVAKATDFLYEGASQLGGKALVGAAKGVKAAAPAIAAEELWRHDRPIWAAMALVGGYGGLRHMIMDKGLDEVENFGTLLARSGASGRPIFQQASRDIEDMIKTEKELELYKRANLADKITPDLDTPINGKPIATENLKGADLEIRQIQEKQAALQKKLDVVNRFAGLNRVITDGAKLGMATVPQVKATGMLLGGFSAAGAMPSQTEEASKEGTETGYALGMASGPMAAGHGFRAAARDSLIKLGKSALPDSHPGFGIHNETMGELSKPNQDHVNEMAGFLKPTGGNVVVVPDGNPLLVSDAGMPPKKGGSASPNGRFDPDSNTLYLNSGALESGVAFHEGTHSATAEAVDYNGQKFAADIVRRAQTEPAVKAALDNFQNKYTNAARLSDPNYRERTPEELRDEAAAELGRMIFTKMPPSVFYGGKSGGRILGDWIGRATDWIVGEDKSIRTVPGFDAPHTAADEAALTGRLYDVGEAARAGETIGKGTPAEEASSSAKLSEAPAKRVELTPDESAAKDTAKAALESSFRVKNKGDRQKIQIQLDQAVADAQSEGVPLDAEDLYKRVVNPQHPVKEGEFGKKGYTALSEAKVPEAKPEGKLGEAAISGAQKPESTANAPRKAVTPESLYASADQAEADLRERGFGKKQQKTIDKEVNKARVEAMAQHHAAQNPDSDLVTWRVDKWGKTSISGRRIDPTDPFHKILLDKAGLDEANRAKLVTLSDNMGKTIGIDYEHAPEEESPSGISRKPEQEAAPAQARVEGTAPRRKLSKTYVPTGFTFNTPSGTLEVNGFSPDKFYNNAQIVIPWMKGHGMETWKGINDPQLHEDMQKYATLHANDHTVDGKPIVGTEKTSARPNPDFNPKDYAIDSKDKRDGLVAMMNDTSAQSAKGRPVTEIQGNKRSLAQVNAPFFDPATGETSKIRNAMGEEAKLLEATRETTRPELIHDIRPAEGVGDEQTLRPSGFKGDRSKLAEKGLPKSEYNASGFMPWSKNAKDRLPSIRKMKEDVQDNLSAKGILPVQKDGTSKAWIDPNGKIIPLKGWHSDWLKSNPETAKEWGVENPQSLGHDEKDAGVKQGAARVNISKGQMIVEAQQSAWPKIKDSVMKLAEDNADYGVMGLNVKLFNDDLSKVVGGDYGKIDADARNVGKMDIFSEPTKKNLSDAMLERNKMPVGQMFNSPDARLMPSGSDGRLKEAAEDFDRFNRSNRRLAQAPSVGDPAWGKQTQAERNQWRRDAEHYAQENSLRFDGTPLGDVSDRDLASEIGNTSQQHEESMLYKLAEEHGFGEDIDALQEAMDRARSNDRLMPSSRVNIGLHTDDGGKITPEEAIAALKKHGVTVPKFSVHQSNTEPTLVADLSRALTPQEAHQVAIDLKQQSIAQHDGTTGDLHGPKADAWRPFNPDYFLDHEGKPMSASGEMSGNLSEKQPSISDKTPMEPPATESKLGKAKIPSGAVGSGVQDALAEIMRRNAPEGRMMPASDHQSELDRKMDTLVNATNIYPASTGQPTGRPEEGFDRAFHVNRVAARMLNDFNTIPDQKILDNPNASENGKRNAKYRIGIKKSAYGLMDDLMADFTATLPKRTGLDLVNAGNTDPFLAMKESFPNGRAGDMNNILSQMADINSGIRSLYGKQGESRFGSSGQNLLNLSQLAESVGVKLNEATKDKIEKAYSGMTHKEAMDSEARAFAEMLNPEFNDVSEQNGITVSRPIQFMPSSHPEAIDKPAVRFPDGKVYTGFMHAAAWAKGTENYTAEQLGKWAKEYGHSHPEEAANYAEVGWTQNNGNFVPSKEALALAIKHGQITKEGIKQARDAWGLKEDQAANKPIDHLESMDFASARKDKKNLGDARLMPASEPFYSQLQRTIESQPDKANPDQLRAAIMKGLGVKQAELRETKDLLGTSFEQYLKDNPKATKQDMLNFVNENKVKIGEVTKGHDDSIAEAWWNDEGGANESKPWSELTPAERQAAASQYREEAGQWQENAPKFDREDLNIPGAREGTYGETSVTVPTEEPKPPTLEKRGKRWIVKSGDGKEFGDYENKATAQEAMGRANMYKVEPQWKGPHTEVPNEILHIRHDLRDLPDGKTGFMLQELQSDLHARGRKEGYITPNPEHDPALSDRGMGQSWAGILVQAERNGFPEAWAKLHPDDPEWYLSLGRDGRANPEAVALAKSLNKGFGENVDAYDHFLHVKPSSGTIPDLPFKGNAWKQLGMKVALKKAIESGADELMWTTGEQQKARYDLSKHIDSIQYAKLKDGNIDIVAVKDGNSIIDKTATPEELPGIVGKDIAQKILNDEGEARSLNYTKMAGRNLWNAEDMAKSSTGGFRELSGLDLKVGGEWANNLYDKEMVNIANDLGKKYGARATMRDIGEEQYYVSPRPQGYYTVVALGGKDAEPIDVKSFSGEGAKEKAQALSDQKNSDFNKEIGPTLVHSLPITPEMKADIAQKGQPLFMPSSHPDAIKEAAMRYPDGKVFTGANHFSAMMKAAAHYGGEENLPRGVEDGYVTNSQEFLDRAQAAKRGIQHGQIRPQDVQSIPAYDDATGIMGDKPYLEANAFNKAQAAMMPRLLKPVKQWMTEDEANGIRDRDASKVTKALRGLDLNRGAELAMMGKSKKTWYQDSLNAIHGLFGHESDRFAALLAAMSPQIGLEANLQNSLKVWNAWKDAGEPTDKASISRIIAENATLEKEGSGEMTSWVNNAHRALSATDASPSALRLSGPKVDSFYRNLRGDLNELTNDTHMSHYARGEWGKDNIFSASRYKKYGADKIGGKGFQYIAMNIHLRQVADHLTNLTGENWTPAEAQSTIWSYMKTIKELADAKKVTPMELLSGMPKDKIQEAIANTPDFATLMNTQQNETAIQKIRDRSNSGTSAKDNPAQEQPRAKGKARKALSDASLPEGSLASVESNQPF